MSIDDKLEIHIGTMRLSNSHANSDKSTHGNFERLNNNCNEEKIV